jgi:hypothetical protein
MSHLLSYNGHTELPMTCERVVLRSMTIKKQGLLRATLEGEY